MNIINKLYNNIMSGIQSDDKMINTIIIGPSNAGKTSLLIRLEKEILNGKERVIGFGVKTIQYKNIDIRAIIDLQDGNQNALSSLWHFYFKIIDSIIFFVDISDFQRLIIANQELSNILSNELLINKPLLIFANKIDSPSSINIDELSNILNLNQYYDTRKLYVQPISTITGVGVDDGFNWLINNSK